MERYIIEKSTGSSCFSYLTTWAGTSYLIFSYPQTGIYSIISPVSQIFRLIINYITGFLWPLVCKLWDFSAFSIALSLFLLLVLILWRSLIHYFILCLDCWFLLHRSTLAFESASHSNPLPKVCKGVQCKHWAVNIGLHVSLITMWTLAVHLIILRISFLIYKIGKI